MIHDKKYVIHDKKRYVIHDKKYVIRQKIKNVDFVMYRYKIMNDKKYVRFKHEKGKSENAFEGLMSRQDYLVVQANGP